MLGVFHRMAYFACLKKIAYWVNSQCELIYLMGGMKLLNLSIKTLLFLEFLRLLFLFTTLCILGVNKQALFNQFLLQKDSQFDRKKET